MKLQDYIECERRFELKYILQQAWPALRSEPVILIEKQMQLGKQFHLLAQQLFSGIPESDIAQQIDDINLLEWWQNFLPFALPLTKNDHYPEYKLSGRINNSPFIAVFDLLVITKENQFIIYDWKTSQKKQTRSELKEKIQSRLYPLLLAQAGKYIRRDAPAQPDSIEMVYWFTNYPNEPETFQYSENQYEIDIEYFTNLLNEISHKFESGFEKTENLRRCKFCQYRSYCERGDQAGLSEAVNEELWAEQIENLDIMQIGEIEF